MSRALLAIALLAACSGDDTTAATPPPVPTSEPSRPDVTGRWRATLSSPGGELPFELRIDEADDGKLSAFVSNGPGTTPMSSVTWEGRELVLRFGQYDSEIRATGGADKLSGRWIETTATGRESMRFNAKKGKGPRFNGPAKMPPHNVPVSINGEWAVTFTDADKAESPGLAIFEANAKRMDATFLTDHGDLGWIEGRYKQGYLELSAFDGADALLLIGAVDKDGGLVGDLWSRTTEHRLWKAKLLGGDVDNPLPDPYGVVALSDKATDGRLAFSFPDLDGKTVTQDDPRFSGKVVLVDVCGTWCPNCHEYAAVLAKWQKTYGPKGLQIVGLSFELKGDPERDGKLVRSYADAYGLKFPILLAGKADKAKAAEALPALTKIAAYPTTILVGRDGKVRKIHSGFAGSATGRYHTAMVADLESQIEALLAESAPTG